MIIVIESASSTGDSVDTELERAFVALHIAKIEVLGGGKFSDGAGYVVLCNDIDAPAAFTVLGDIGIAGFRLRPKSSPRRVL